MADQPIKEIVPDEGHIEVPLDQKLGSARRMRGTFIIRLRKYWALIALITYIAGPASGYMLHGSARIGSNPNEGKAASA